MKKFYFLIFLVCSAFNHNLFSSERKNETAQKVISTVTLDDGMKFFILDKENVPFKKRPLITSTVYVTAQVLPFKKRPLNKFIVATAAIKNSAPASTLSSKAKKSVRKGGIWKNWDIEEIILCQKCKKDFPERTIHSHEQTCGTSIPVKQTRQTTKKFRAKKIRFCRNYTTQTVAIPGEGTFRINWSK